MIGHKDISPGIVGLVAARIAEARHRPAIVFQEGPTESRASCRSIPEFDIVAAIRREKELLLRHGGHRAAAGFTVRNENIDALRERLVNTAAELLREEQLRPVIDIDAETPMAGLTGIEIKGLMRFEPCGHGNRRPVLMSRNVQLSEAKQVGRDQTHLKVKLKQGAVTWPGIAFRRGDMLLSGNVDVVYTLSREWKSDRVELELLDIAPSGEAHPLEMGP